MLIRPDGNLFQRMVFLCLTLTAAACLHLLLLCCTINFLKVTEPQILQQRLIFLNDEAFFKNYIVSYGIPDNFKSHPK